MAISNADGSIILNTQVDTSGIVKGINSIDSIVKKIGTTIAVAFGTRQLINFGRQAIQLASDLQEVQNVVDVAFGSMSYKIEEFAESAIDKFGISALTAKRTASTYMAMAKGMGIAEDVASDMAITMTGLTADIASFYNMSQERADVILKSVYTGETETLKQLGIVMTEVNLENFAMSKGITKSIDAMTQQEKTMLRYQFVLEQTRLAQGDFARTSDSWANQTRILTERWKEAQAVWGEAFIMIGTMLLPKLNELVEVLTQVGYAAQIAAKWVYQTVTGKEYSEESSKAEADAISGATENQKDLTDEVKKTEKEQQKLLASFDELQILNGKKSTDNLLTNELLDGKNISKGNNTTSESKSDLSAQEYHDKLGEIGKITGLALVGLGILMIFMGHPLLGIGMVVAGEIFIASTVLSGIGDEEKRKLSEIAAITGAALIGLGILLLFTPYKGRGLGMVAAGASLIYESLVLGEFSEDIQTKITNILTITGLVMVVLGTILLFVPGVTGFGIALLAAGAGELATAAIMNATEIKDWLETNLWTIVEMLGKFLFLFGIVMCFMPGMMNIGFGLMVAGIAIIAVAEITPNFDALKETLTDFFKQNWEAVLEISAAFIIIGIILCMTASRLVGIGLIATGAGLLFAEIVLNFDALKETLIDFFEQNWELITLMSIALIIIGIILCMTASRLVGIGLIATGAVGLFAETILNWDSISIAINNFIEDNYDKIMGFANGMVVLGVILLFTPAWAVGLALLATGVGTAIGTKKANMNLSGIKKELNKNLEDLNSEAQKGINKINNTLSQINFSNGFNAGFGNFTAMNMSGFSVPKLARGAVIPPNREFLAVLGDQKQGTNIEAPLDTITQAVNIALNERNIGSNQPIVLQIGEQEMARFNMDLFQEEAKRRLVMFGG